MSSKPTQNKSWDTCPSGLLSQTAERRLETEVEQHRRKRRTILWVAISFTLTLMLVSYSLIEAQPVAPNYDASLGCQTVRGNLAAFCNNQIRDVSLGRGIGKHLMNCESCRKVYKSTCESSHKCPNRIRQAIPRPSTFK